MTWSQMIYFALPSVALWALGAWASFRKRYVPACLLTACGIATFGLFIALLWASLQRPPLRTMGETRLCYAFFLPLTGLITYVRWRYKWILTFSTLLATVFVCINLFNPELHNKALMPALQSPWFTPHVTIYMFAYALLGGAASVALCLLIRRKASQRELALCDDLVLTGLAFITLGMLTGALWAKQAWGHYWSWDPKETWAAITWFSCLTYIHLRCRSRAGHTLPMVVLLITFLLLQMCWWGINYLPAAQGTSIHTYS